MHVALGFVLRRSYCEFRTAVNRDTEHNLVDDSRMDKDSLDRSRQSILQCYYSFLLLLVVRCQQ